MSADAPDFQRRELRRNRLIATALLGAMAALFVATALVPQPGFWMLLVRATAEAALVGGLADWFAVTALFRQPLGLPIPHTAIVPKNKDRIGRRVAMLHRAQFSDARDRQGKAALDSIRRASRRLAGLAGKCRRRRPFAWCASMPHLLGAVDDREIREFRRRVARSAAGADSSSLRCSGGPSRC